MIFFAKNAIGAKDNSPNIFKGKKLELLFLWYF